LKVLGVDPGLTRCGWGLVSTELKTLGHGLFTSPAGSDPRDRVGGIARELSTLVDENQPDFIAIERVFAQQNLRSVMGVAQISGALLAVAFERKIPVHFFTPTEVKSAVAGSGRAPKDQVGVMVATTLGLSEAPKPADVADALAVAICAIRKGVAGTSAQQRWVEALNERKRR
jgi:crossover junction endodeoxyribonuclease RuvC